MRLYHPRAMHIYHARNPISRQSHENDRASPRIRAIAHSAAICPFATILALRLDRLHSITSGRHEPRQTNAPCSSYKSSQNNNPAMHNHDAGDAPILLGIYCETASQILSHIFRNSPAVLGLEFHKIFPVRVGIQKCKFTAVDNAP